MASMPSSNMRWVSLRFLSLRLPPAQEPGHAENALQRMLQIVIMSVNRPDNPGICRQTKSTAHWKIIGMNSRSPCGNISK